MSVSTKNLKTITTEKNVHFIMQNYRKKIVRGNYVKKWYCLVSNLHK